MSGEMRNAYRSLVIKREGKVPLEHARHGWEDNIKLNLKKKRSVRVWIGLIWVRMESTGRLL
jgi:hypothetical protein